jgi:2Fe-2S ferredoxin
MGGNNPYIAQSDHPLPQAPYSIRFLPGERQLVVDPTRIPYSDDGLPGSILEIALGHGLAIDHACGGVCACSTCHIWVREGLEACNPATDAEEDMLDNARAFVVGRSRLACQCVPDGSRDIVVEIPAWNRNLARE